MQDTFQWTDELVSDFLKYHFGQFEPLNTSMEQFKSSKSPKKEWEVWLTEDGVEVPIIEGNKLFYVETFTYKIGSMTFADHVNVNGIRGKFPQFKYFSTREAAEAYILNNRPLLSLSDVKEALFKQLGDTPNARYLLEPLTALVKQKLNQ